MLHFSPETNEIENGWVEFQVKATDHIRQSRNGKWIACTVEMAHLHYWYWENVARRIPLASLMEIVLWPTE